ncbi:HAD family hydrolase [Fluviicola taffensis]|uniref:HAD-superfamily hydrolase, subfamily IA, variant 3 n=1 Tax=Fluviicola taffensis (strain DSM 16823 / NCIMB 13979 / RW262) TaxID=755732 RepID=F2IC66_FLUTR|nr:HAD family phosphatase [Fluviicola taffensis]AEA43292.1 HAD-superfamily hydrolase, subfamily IA, variant 3 [Fluviicola taffensis DSM 16823]
MINTSKEAIIFDLGGVLLNLDYDLTEKAFISLGMKNFGESYSQLQQTNLFDRFERGEVSSFHFVNQLLDRLPFGTTANQVVHAWDAMILDFPTKRLQLLEELATKYRLFLLSNTNDIHIDAVRRSLEKSVGHKNLEQYFEKTYFSSAIGMRKPDSNIFEFVCSENNLDPVKTLFIDDSPQHVEGAKSAGIEGLLLAKNQEVFDLPFFLT